MFLKNLTFGMNLNFIYIEHKNSNTTKVHFHKTDMVQDLILDEVCK